MGDKIRWGVLSTANIGLEKVIPAMQAGDYCEVTAIASRGIESAHKAAQKLGIAKAYGSYGELLADKDVDAIYIPLPNHMHVEWAIKCLEAGKHVLCEKPIGLSSAEAQKLLDVSGKYPHLKIMEAFMYRLHPQWLLTKKLVKEGKIGQLRTIQSFFSYYNTNPDNIRNKKELGGGALMDIGCYCISLSRFIFNEEPQTVLASIEIDPKLGTDRLVSGILNFSGGTSSFSCSTQLTAYQAVHIIGTLGKIEIEIPFNAPVDKPTKIWLQTGAVPEEIEFSICNQYTIQADAFSKAILDDTEVPTPLLDALNNMRVIDALFESAKIDN